VLVTTADHDDRVVPAHSFKYAAALQAAQGGDAPILIRIETKAGHGAGKPTAKLIEEAADVYTFLTKALGVSAAEGNEAPVGCGRPPLASTRFPVGPIRPPLTAAGFPRLRRGDASRKLPPAMPKRTDIESILIIGSGPIVIGQACEFDYSGTQACASSASRGTASSSSTRTRRRS